MNIEKICMSVLVAAAAVGYAASPDDDDIFMTEDRGRWTFSAGPAWRSRVKIGTRGRIEAPEAPTARSTSKVDMMDSENWGKADAKKVKHPSAGVGTLDDDDELWGIDATRIETYGYAGQDYVVDMSDVERPMGVNLQAAYDLYRTESWSIALALRFAGYWNLQSSSEGYYNAGSRTAQTWADHYIFPEESPDATFDPDPEFSTIVENGTTLESTMTETFGSRAVSTRFRGDLYQIGVGPKLCWSPFADEDGDGWLQVYCGAELLGNFARSKFSADGDSTSDTDFLFGAGGMFGVVGNITENCGVFGQVGYEWVDDTDISAGRFRADIDYSSLVVSAGLHLCF